MSPGPAESATPGSALISACEAEKSARPSDQTRQTSARTPKLRSCVVCRSRKVRCDKLSPCSNCRRANVACVFPATERPPRWARRFDRPVTGEVMERIHYLENLVKDLTDQLEQAHASGKALTKYPSRASPTSSVARQAHSQITLRQQMYISNLDDCFYKMPVKAST